MLVKGVLKNNVLSTELGSFHVNASEGKSFSDLENGVFELSQIKTSLLDRSVTVEGYKTTVKIPITHATVLEAYRNIGMKQHIKSEEGSDQSKESQKDQSHSLKKNEEKKVAVNDHSSDSKSNEIHRGEAFDCNSTYVSPHLDDEIALFGKPISELGDTYKPDKSMKRDTFKRIFAYLEKRGCAYNAASRSWDLTGVLL